MKKRTYSLMAIVLYVILVCSLNSSAGIIYVNTSGSIQAEIDAATDGDIVLALPGTYNENINFKGKAITLGSKYISTGDVSYISQTIIDGGQNGRVISFSSGEKSSSVLSGFTITNGSSQWGGGIYLYQSGPTLRNLVITGNSADSGGGGIEIANKSNPVIEHVTIYGNSSGLGGGINISYESGPVIKHAIIYNNSAQSGGGINCFQVSPSFEFVTVYGNSAEIGGALLSNESDIGILNSIFWNNMTQEIYMVDNGANPSSITISYSDIQGGVSEIVSDNGGVANWLDGNVNSDPLFNDPENGDYSLKENSPCIDTGENDSDMGAVPYDSSAGTLKWTYGIGTNSSSPPAVGADGTIYFGANDGLYAIYPNGTLKWKFEKFDGTLPVKFTNAPVIGSDGSIYACAETYTVNSDYIYAINPNGTMKWKYLIGDIKSYSSLALGIDGTIYVPSFRYYLGLCAINPNGTLKWSGGPAGPVAVGIDGTIYISESRLGVGSLHAVNPDGSSRWEFTFSGGFDSLALDNSGIIYGGSGGDLYAVNHDGTLKWKKTINENTVFYCYPVIGEDGTIYIGSGVSDEFYAIAPDGSVKWKIFLYGVSGWNHAVIGADGNIYIASTGSTIYSVNPSGFINWGLNVNDYRGFLSPSIGQDGTLYALASIAPQTSALLAVNTNCGGLANAPWPMFQHDARHTGNPNPEKSFIPLALDTEYQGEIMPRKQNYFSFEASPEKSLIVEVIPQAGTNSIIFDGSFGSVPAYPESGEYTTKNTAHRGNYELLISPTQAGTYYFSVFGENIESSGGSYTIKARYMDQLYLSDISVKSALNQGNVTLNLTGIGFTQGTLVLLTNPSFPQLNPSEIIVSSETELSATFEFNGTQTGIYSVRIEQDGENPSVLENAFDIKSNGTPGHLSVKLTAPPAIRTNREYSFEIEYENDGDTDMPVPLFVIRNSLNADMRLSQFENRKQQIIQVLGIIHDRFFTIRMSPGRSGRFRGSFVVSDFDPNGLRLEVERMIADLTYINWAEIENDIRPDDINNDAWNIIWNNFKAQLGSTWKDYYDNLTNGGMYVGNYKRLMASTLIGGELSVEPFDDISQFEVGNLLAFEFAKALAMLCPRSVLASVQDVFIPAPGLPLVFERFAFQSIENRFSQGALGRGWTHTYDYMASIDDEGNIRIKGPDKASRIFYFHGDGDYRPVAGDYGRITLGNGIITLYEKDGIIWQFETGGKLVSIEDPNKNKLTLSYQGDRIEKITHSNGESISVGYNGNGRISQITDPAQRTVIYRYDSDGEHLSEVEEPGGVITGYDYYPSGGTSYAHALKTITFPDKTHQYYSYDDKGRLNEEWKDGNSEHLTYAYDSQGTVTITDGLDHSTVIRFGRNGEILEIQDPLKSLTHISYDGKEQISQFVHPDRKKTSVAYDTKGNPIGVMNQLDHLVQMSYEPEHNRLDRLEDARNNVTEFGYDDAGNLKKIVYPDKTSESYDYDTSGKIDGYTNRRRQYIDYTTNNRGQITKKVYPDGRTIDYTYNSEGKLEFAIDSLTGTISMKYDGRGFLEQIDYPGGYGFVFEYNDAGRRAKRTGHDGYILNYGYDEAGRLETITDKTGKEIIRYGYDVSGRLENETKGNGTVTIYEYDDAGQLLHMINYSPGGVVQSRFDYTYDENGNRDSMTTLDGTTYYEYDDIDQLVKVTYPDKREVSYEYDAAGNRISVTDNGVTTSYTTNNMNQYTQVGNTGYGYDDDGNMDSKTDGSGTTTYAYDAENRLTSVVSPNGTWEYVYDALGNRITVEHDGSVKRYMHDPIGLVDVAGEYDESGELLARYVHGLGLVARFDGAGNGAYYSFDGIGNTRQLTNSMGTVVNTYDYSPFGIPLQADEVVSNPFRYVGRFGVMDEKNELYFMRARHYSSDVGHFLSQDPIHIEGNDLNLYRYVCNVPTMFIDPIGYYSLRTYLGTFGPPVLQGLGRGFAIYGIYTINLPLIGLGAAMELAGYLWGWYENFELVSPLLREYGQGLGRLEPSGMDKLGGYSPKQPEGSSSSEIIHPIDPNEKTGYSGISSQHYITGNEKITYTIDFENKSEATAPAQEVFITDYLDKDLDWSTFQLGEVAFGKHLTTSLSDKQTGKAQVILDDMAVDIEAQFNHETGLIRWTLRTIDLKTGQLPEDAYAGFLPPEDGKGSGQGHVTFTIHARKNLAAGTLITNKASIVFDTEAPIVTNEVFNTITDDAPDASTVVPVVASGSTDVQISTVLSWNPCNYATSYDLYLWESTQEKPDSPTAENLESPFYDASNILEYDTAYNWQIIAKNVMGESQSPIWSFTTETEKTDSATISGQITSAGNGQPIANVCVNAVDKNNNWAGGSKTDENGSYAITALPAGNYYIKTHTACEIQQNFADKSWDSNGGIANLDAGELVSANPGETTENINFVLEEGGFITGRVMNSDSQALPNICINVYDNDWARVGGNRTDENGNYSVVTPAGSYYVSTHASCTNPSNYIDGCWNGEDSITGCGKGELVSVITGQTTPDVNFTLIEGGMISGSVTATNGQTVTGVCVNASYPCGNWRGGDVTDENGFYSFPIPTGNYYISVDVSCGGSNIPQQYFINEIWNGKEGTIYCNEAESVTSVSGQYTENINFTLETGGTISGHVYQSDGVTPVSNLRIIASEYDTWIAVGDAFTDKDGSYSTSGLNTGEYRIHACASCSGLQYIIDKFFDNASNGDNANSVSVTRDHETKEINFRLDKGGEISGTVVTDTGQPFVNAEISSHKDKCGADYNSVFTDENGKYTITVPQGDFYIFCGGESVSPLYSPEWWNNGDGTADCNYAVSVTSGTDQTTLNINFSLNATNATGRLNDAILALQALAGLKPDGVPLITDVNGDDKIGMEEVIHILQTVSGFRITN
ncbi:MAG: PQQ-binding-like beta-propeller repeat protein [Desulfobacterales bacterium]|nr:PQQ-binding-like beta-propeller repeat protein [Desulfobacterales bacterium]